ncbi:MULTISPECIES: ATP-binding cassette domain-containing protein [unclassified Arcicella]|uniref:cell division ATP-binding protein FtsE n=1 Tax=unclassified Arcicella TaxID=2644986 RepID=UPI0028661D7A|nr:MULTISPECIES: ATP-binding cassette domain-containing protein [unclassified Arcicella]MDR6562940.1 cell division transport system ATP-binding protein [Arcicella sp. BE51]MDR6813023.1 cell division transport system ATP-binding protein [Arcicella sp. BE140]MDR6824337.1 cell division transport system ATP-binding protein [Arcicella sp. BE139]
MFTSEPVVVIESAFVYQNERVVLSDVNFSINKGEFVFLIGRTGSGKSSLLKTLYADLWLQQGKAKVAGFIIEKLKLAERPFLRRKIGVVFQDFQLFMDRNVQENLMWVLEATGWSDSAKMKARVAEVLMQVGMSTSRDKMPHQLSGGEQQRVVIARALLNEPQILFADEPTGNLDPEVSGQILELFHEINKAGTAILMATHDFDMIRKFPARILKCENGQVKEQ